MSAETVGFIGLGHMGEGMSRRLLGRGHKLVVWNRSAAKAKALEADGKGMVSVVPSPAAVVRACAVTYVMLSEPKAVQAVYEMPDGVLDAVSAGKSIVDCATLAVADMERLASQVTTKGGRFLEAPVSGSKGPAAQGQLIFLAAGDEGLYRERAADFDVMGKAKFFFGKVGGGTRMKLAVNMIMGTMLASLGEGMGLVAKAGIDPAQLLQVLELGVMNNPMFKLKGPKMIAADFTPNFPLKHAEKDVRLAVALGGSLGLGLPIAAAADAAMNRGIAQGLGDQDFAAVYEAQKTTAALPGTLGPMGALALALGSAALGAMLARRR